MKRGWEDNIKMDIEEIGWNYLDWIHVTEDRDKWRALANTFMDLLVPAGNFLTSWGVLVSQNGVPWTKLEWQYVRTSKWE